MNFTKAELITALKRYILNFDEVYKAFDHSIPELLKLAIEEIYCYHINYSDRPDTWDEAEDNDQEIIRAAMISLKEHGTISYNECQSDESEFIECIGKDGKRHYCRPHEDVCICGEKILKKKLLRDDYKRFGCYDCSY